MNVRAIVQEAASIYGAPLDSVINGRNGQNAWQAKRLAVYVLKRRGMSYGQIGKALGHRDHTTAVSSFRYAKNMYETDPEFRRNCDRLAHGNRVMNAADIGIGPTFKTKLSKPRTKRKAYKWTQLPYGRPMWGAVERYNRDKPIEIRWQRHMVEASQAMIDRLSGGRAIG